VRSRNTEDIDTDYNMPGLIHYGEVENDEENILKLIICLHLYLYHY